MNNISKLQSAMAEAGIDAILLTDIYNRHYATGFRSSAGEVFILRDGAWFFTDSRYIEAAQAAVANAQVSLIGAGHRAKDSIAELISEYSVAKLGFEEDSTSYAAYQRLKSDYTPELVPCQGLLRSLRGSKSTQEVEHMKSAQSIAERTFDDILGIIKPGLSEREIAAELTYRMLKYGGEGNSFDPIVVTGRKSSMPHGVPGDELVRQGDFITMDFGCVKNGYCSDMTRTVAVGYATDEMRRVYDVVLEAQFAGIGAARPGVTGRDIDAAARGVIERAGYGEYFGHSFGHSLGLEVHEEPNASPTASELMPDGAIISAEPGIYIPGKFGVRIEDVLWLHGDLAENLMKSPKNLIIL